MYTAREQADILKELQDASEIEASKSKEPLKMMCWRLTVWSSRK